VVDVGAESEVVDEHDGSAGDLLAVLRRQEIALHQFVLAVLFPVPAHPFTEMDVHALKQNDKR